MAEGERVEFDEVVNPDTPATEGTAEKPVETPEKEVRVVTSNSSGQMKEND